MHTQDITTFSNPHYCGIKADRQTFGTIAITATKEAKPLITQVINDNQHKAPFEVEELIRQVVGFICFER